MRSFWCEGEVGHEKGTEEALGQQLVALWTVDLSDNGTQLGAKVPDSVEQGPGIHRG